MGHKGAQPKIMWKKAVSRRRLFNIQTALVSMVVIFIALATWELISTGSSLQGLLGDVGVEGFRVSHMPRCHAFVDERTSMLYTWLTVFPHGCLVYPSVFQRFQLCDL